MRRERNFLETDKEYFCDKCNVRHKKSSKIGQNHKRYKFHPNDEYLIGVLKKHALHGRHITLSNAEKLLGKTTVERLSEEVPPRHGSNVRWFLIRRTRAGAYLEL